MTRSIPRRLSGSAASPCESCGQRDCAVLVRFPDGVRFWLCDPCAEAAAPEATFTEDPFASGRPRFGVPVEAVFASFLTVVALLTGRAEQIPVVAGALLVALGIRWLRGPS